MDDFGVISGINFAGHIGWFALSMEEVGFIGFGLRPICDVIWS